MGVTIPYVKDQILKNKDFKKDLVEQFENTYTLLKCGLKIPIKLLEFMNSDVAGKMKIQMEYAIWKKASLNCIK